MMEPNQNTRRELLQFGAAAGAASILGGCKMFNSRKADVVAQAKENEAALTRAESAKLLASEGSLLVEVEGRSEKILVVRGKDSGLHAVSAVCTHMGCSVLYDEKLGSIRCPCHGSQYELDGQVVKGPAARPLRQYDVRNDNGLVVITLG